MERLTYVAENGEVLFHPADLPDDEGITITQLAKDGRYKALEEIAERLANREQAEEQGLLLRLPCKVGDKAWYINKPFILEYEVTGFSVDETGAWLMQIEHYVGETDRTYGYNLETDSLGTTWFLSKEEAEAKLKETEDANVHECD